MTGRPPAQRRAHSTPRVPRPMSPASTATSASGAGTSPTPRSRWRSLSTWSRTRNIMTAAPALPGPRGTIPVVRDRRESFSGPFRLRRRNDALMAGDPLTAFFESLPLRGAADRTITPAEIEAAGGMPVARIRELMEAFGLPPANADEGAFTPAEAEAVTELWRQRELWPFE